MDAKAEREDCLHIYVVGGSLLSARKVFAIGTFFARNEVKYGLSGYIKKRALYC